MLGGQYMLWYSWLANIMHSFHFLYTAQIPGAKAKADLDRDFQHICMSTGHGNICHSPQYLFAPVCSPFHKQSNLKAVSSILPIKWHARARRDYREREYFTQLSLILGCRGQRHMQLKWLYYCLCADSHMIWSHWLWWKMFQKYHGAHFIAITTSSNERKDPRLVFSRHSETAKIVRSFSL